MSNICEAEVQFQIVRNYIQKRPETSKCSRLEMRRKLVQSQQQRVRQPHNPIQEMNGLTLEQYFRNPLLKDNTNKNAPSFRIKSNRQKQPQKQQVPAQHYTQMDWMVKRGDVVQGRFTKERFFNMKQNVEQRIQQQEQELYNKYATKFNIDPPRPTYNLKEIYGKLK